MSNLASNLAPNPSTPQSLTEESQWSASRLNNEAAIWGVFKGDIIMADSRVKFTAQGREKWNEWFEPWGIEIDSIRTRAQLVDAFLLWDHLSGDECKSALELEYWSIHSSGHRKEIEELLGYVPPKPLNYEDVDKRTFIGDVKQSIASVFDDFAAWFRK